MLADNNDFAECPPTFDYADSLRRLREVIGGLKALCNRDFVLDDAVEDATHFASLYIPKRFENPIPHDKMVFALHFSCFGNLFTASMESPLTDILCASTIQAIIELVESHGFVYVDPDSLDGPYDGLNPSFVNSTWRHRFFDYL